MIGYTSQANCSHCKQRTYLKHAGYYDDGSQRLLCSCCEKDGGVLHSCTQDNPLSSPTWLPLVVAGIGIVCPRCKKTYDLGVTIEPVYPEAGEALKIVGLLTGILVAIGVVSDLLQSRKRGRH